MARSQTSHDGGIVERRLRPIYDWLDNCNNKKALQESDKVLKKTPKLQAARALKALALLRLGRAPEAHAVLDELAAENPSDDTTLQAMAISYRESQQMSKMCSLYEAAVKAEPNSEELYSQLFMAYVRVGDYRSQQRAAMALYKFAPKNPYYFWAVMSIVMQAKSTDDSSKKGILLTLAQRMVDNFISENKMEAEQEARLYIMILELQEKWKDILNFIEGPLYSKLVPGSTAPACIPYLKKLGQWKRLNLICKYLLLENPDRWDYYMPYFDSVFQLIENNETEDESNETTMDNTAEKCHEFICTLVENMSNGKTLRGPYLARMELWRRLSVNGDPSSLIGSPVALCIQYLRVFAHKPCAVPDLRSYLEMIPQKDREENCQEFLSCLGFDVDSEPETIDDIQRQISCICAWRITSPEITSPEENLRLATKLRDNYMRCLKKGLVTATTTEFCAADGYGTLAAHFYFSAALQQQSSAPIIEALCLLELVLHQSPSNFHAKLLLVKLYHFIGSPYSADIYYQKLEVKHIQLLSLNWLHAARLAPGCASSKALQLLADTRLFHTHHAKDGMEHLTYAYKYGTFEKLVELYAWNARLGACAACAHCARETATLALLAGPSAPLHAPNKLPEKPTDNRDLEVIVNWDPPQFMDPDLKSRTFDQDLAYLRLKDGLVSCISLCIELAENRPMEEKIRQYEELKTCVDAFSKAIEMCSDKYNVKEKISISAPFSNRIIAFVTSQVPYRLLYATVFSMVAELSVTNQGTYKLCEEITSLVASSVDTLKAEIGTGGDFYWEIRDRLESMSNYLEFIGVITYLLGVCNELVTPTNTKKLKKKAQRTADQIKTNELLTKMNETVQICISEIENIFDDWQVQCTNEQLRTLGNDFRKHCVNPEFESDIFNRLVSGQNSMGTDIKNILSKKTKYLKSLI